MHAKFFLIIETTLKIETRCLISSNHCDYFDAHKNEYRIYLSYRQDAIENPR